MSASPEIQTDERELVKRLKNPATAREAFNTLMRLYGESIYWQIRKLVVNHDDANDILQNTFLKAWNNIDNFRGDARLTTWLYKIAVNESINHLNRERSRRNINADSESAEFLTERLEADPYFDGNDVQLRLQKAIAALPDKQRLVFNMRYFDEMKYEKMSEILGTSVGALKASYHHAVKKIEQAFAED